MATSWRILLVNGYIRELGLELNKIRSVIIPIGVTQLCFDYYNASQTIMLLLKYIDEQNCGLYIADIANNINWVTNVYELKPTKNKSKKKNKQQHRNRNKTNHQSSNGNHLTQIPASQYLCDNSATYYQTNFTVSQSMHNKIINCYSKNNDNYFNSSRNEYNAIFKYNHNANRCNAFLFHQNQLNKQSQQKITAFNWRLPSLPNIRENSLIYHNEYGLISIGGYSNNKNWILNINADKNQLKWINDSNILPNTPKTRYLATCILNDDESKLFRIGGVDMQIVTCQQTVDMFDFKNNHWRKIANMNYCKARCGAVYDNINKRIYVGGGHGWTGNNVMIDASQRMEYYEVDKNKWYSLCDTIYKHYENPLIWIDNVNKDILYIASISADCVEFIDLRIDQKVSQWNQWKDLKVSTNVFGTTCQWNHSVSDRFCLLK